MNPDFSATNMKIFEIVGKLISKLAWLCRHPDCSVAYHDVDDAFVEYVAERNMQDKVIAKLEKSKG